MKRPFVGLDKKIPKAFAFGFFLVVPDKKDAVFAINIVRQKKAPDKLGNR